MAKVYLTIIFFLLFVFGPSIAHAATLSISPPSGTFEVGERVIVKVIVSSNDVQFNAVSSNILFPSSIFAIESVSKTNSILNFWVTEPVVLKSSNAVKFEGLSLGGFQGFTGTVVTVALRALYVGSGKVVFQSGQVLANDGQGTDITGNLVSATFSVVEAKIKSKVPEPEPPLAPEILQPAPTLKAPEIVLSTKYGVPAILGSSDYPNAQVLITFIAEDGAKVFILGVSDTDGSFNLLVPHSLKSGSYTVSSVIIKEDKTNSMTSNIIIIDVGNIFSDLGIEIWILILLLIIAILYLLLRIYLHFGKDKNINENIKNEVHDAENIVHKSFDIIREDVIDYDNEKLTDTEHKRMSGIKKDISDAEKIIDKKIKDIELI